MTRYLGAIMVIFGCGSIGFLIAKRLLYEISSVRSLISTLEYWENALTYHHTTIPELCRIAHTIDSSEIGEFFKILGEQLDAHGSGNASHCIESTLLQCRDIPASTQKLIKQLARGLGEFDLNGQLLIFRSVLHEANIILEALSSNLNVRLRSYRTLGICAGVAISVLII